MENGKQIAKGKSRHTHKHSRTHSHKVCAIRQQVRQAIIPPDQRDPKARAVGLNTAWSFIEFPIAICSQFMLCARVCMCVWARQFFISTKHLCESTRRLQNLIFNRCVAVAVAAIVLVWSTLSACCHAKVWATICNNIAQEKKKPVLHTERNAKLEKTNTILLKKVCKISALFLTTLFIKFTQFIKP